MSRPADTEVKPVCGCRQCLRDRREEEPPGSGWPVELVRMIVCPICGDKRCPHASDHRYTCTGSTAPDPPGRAVTADGRLLYVGPVLPHHTHAFVLDGTNLGATTLEQAMESYCRKVKALHGGHQPKGGMCLSCARWSANCSELPFSTMPVIETTWVGVRVVRCTAHVRANK